jgi:DNA-binding LacI/PurR family transcriptional regulator
LLKTPGAGAVLRHRYAGAGRPGRPAGRPAPLPAIVGFDDIPQADWQPYQLTTVQQNTALLAHHAVDLLMTRIARFSLPSRHREVPVKLIIRQSAK